MTKFQRAVFEAYAPVALKEYGRKHRCLREVTGARGKVKKVYCRECNLAAIRAAKVIAKVHGQNLRRSSTPQGRQHGR